MLVVTAHPDDESLFLGGVIAYYAAQGVEIHLICATRGEKGQITLNQDLLQTQAGDIRTKELMNAAAILGIQNVEILDYPDGSLCNDIYAELASTIKQKIEVFKPQVVLTFDRLGYSGHLDHIAISMITTFAFLNTKISNKLYYFARSNNENKKACPQNDYFVYFPEGYSDKEITSRIDTSQVYTKHIAAISQHRSQQDDVQKTIKYLQDHPKIAYLILQYYRGVEVKLPETDIFMGLGF